MARLVQPVEGELKLNGLRINYFEWKGRGRRPLVLMHGLRDYAYYWQDCANRLLDDFHVYTFDQRGHGESERAPGGYLVWALAADLAAFVDAVGLDRFDLAGLSLGSRCSMAYARDNWQRLGHLVLMDMGPQMAKVGARGLKADMTAKADVPPSSFAHEDALAFFGRQWPSLDEPSLRRLVQNALVQGEDGLYSNRYDRRLADITTSRKECNIDLLKTALGKFLNRKGGAVIRDFLPRRASRGQQAKLPYRELPLRQNAQKLLPDSTSHTNNSDV